MTLKKLALFSLRMLALYFVATGLMAIPILFTNPLMLSHNIFELLRPYIGYGLPSLTIGLLLWLIAPLLVKCFVKENEEKELSQKTISLFDLYQLSFVIVGLFLLSHALPESITMGFALFEIPGFYQYESPIYGSMVIKLVVPLLKMLMGFWFVFRSHHLAKSLIKSIK